MEKEDKRLEAANLGGSGNIKGDISVLKQLVDSLDESEKKLEEFYKKNDADNFNKAKKFITSITEKISEVIK